MTLDLALPLLSGLAPREAAVFTDRSETLRSAEVMSADGVMKSAKQVSLGLSSLACPTKSVCIGQKDPP